MRRNAQAQASTASASAALDPVCTAPFGGAGGTQSWHKADTETSRLCAYGSGRGAARPHGGGWTNAAGRSFGASTATESLAAVLSVERHPATLTAADPPSLHTAGRLGGGVG